MKIFIEESETCCKKWELTEALFALNVADRAMRSQVRVDKHVLLENKQVFRRDIRNPTASKNPKPGLDMSRP